MLLTQTGTYMRLYGNNGRSSADALYGEEITKRIRLLDA